MSTNNMNAVPAQSIEESLTVFNIQISTWQAKKVLRPEDLPESVRASIPPSELVNLGSKKVFDRDCLKEVNKIRQRIMKFLEKNGVRVFGPTSIGVPSGKEREVYDFIVAKQDEFNTEVREIVSHYDSTLEAYVNRFPEYNKWILDAAPSANEVDKKYKFEFSVFRVTPSMLEVQGEISSLSDKSGSLGEQLFQEISEASKDLLDNSVFSRKDGKISRNAITAARKIRDKMDSLSFLDLRVIKVLDYIDDKLSQLGSSGEIEGTLKDTLVSALSLMASKERMLKFGQDGNEENNGVEETDEPSSDDDSNVYF